MDKTYTAQRDFTDNQGKAHKKGEKVQLTQAEAQQRVSSGEVSEANPA